MADELDFFGVRWRPAAPSFFLRMSNEVGKAILAVGDRHAIGDGHYEAVLRTRAEHIDDLRLRRAFQAAVYSMAIRAETRNIRTAAGMRKERRRKPGFGERPTETLNWHEGPLCNLL